MTSDYRTTQQIKDSQIQQQQKLAKKIKNFIYDPTQVIGSGFSSKVYKGINEHNNQQVAIKVIQLSKIQNQVQKYLLNNQINALRALKHKNILRTIDILMTKNNVYIVTQFCQFGDLQLMIKNNKKLNQKDALNIIKDIVQGYVAIQQRNIIHRDIKTANIFLTKTGAKIADFGFCQLIGQKKPQMSYNVGSPAYMSPESYKQNIYSFKSDIWGIGIILYEMIMGETPQKNLTYSQMSNNLMNGKINCGSNQQIKKILINCFKKDLKQRTDSRNLLNLVNNVIELYNKNGIQQQKNAKLPYVDTRFFSPVSDVIIDTPIRQQKAYGLNQSPSKIFEIRKTDQGRHNSNILPSSGSAKKQIVPLTTSNVAPGNNYKNSDLAQFSKYLKSQTLMLQFLFRILSHINFISINISSLSFVRLILFRHRSYIDENTQILVQKYRVDAKNIQQYQSFQYLKMKFDQTYLQKQHMNTHNQSNHQFMQIMNQFTNTKFIDHQAIMAYKDIMKKCCQEIYLQAHQNKSTIFVVWDYLMMEYEILKLYQQGFNHYIITKQKCPIANYLQEVPNAQINKHHVQLLKIKSQYLFGIITK